MICEQFEQFAPQIAHNELRDPKLLQDAKNHTASCAACNAVLIEALELAVSVASIAAYDKSLVVHGHLESTLLAAFAWEHAANTTPCIADSREIERAGHSPAPTKASGPSHVFVGGTFSWAALSLAAAIILAVIFLPRAFKHNPEANRAAVTPARSPLPAVAPTRLPPIPQAVTHVTQKRLTAPRKPIKNLSEPETTLTGFLALPYADDLSTIEYGAIVRLQMSRADLAWYGLPVPISDTGEKIVADLFVNGSGTPEAIRLVR